MEYATGNNDRCQLVSRPQLRDWIGTAYAEEKANIKTVLNNNAGTISFILDAWTSSNQKAFQGVIACWISDDWKLCHTPIDLSVLQGEHSGSNLAKSLSEVFNEYDIWNQILAITTDNASNMDTLFQELEEMCQEKMIDFNKEEHRVRCMAHIINLACKALMTEVPGDVTAESADNEDPGSLVRGFK